MRLPLKKKPGDPVLATDWNLLLDAIEARTPRPGYDRKKARPVRLSALKPMNGKVKVQGPPVIKLASLQPVRMFTPFERRMLNDWDSPHGEAMNTLLKDIKAAKEAGDVPTYERLTERHTAWAGKYLSRGAKPANKQNP